MQPDPIDSNGRCRKSDDLWLPVIGAKGQPQTT